jgi:hypothetical protein
MFIRKSFKSLVDSFCLDLTQDELNYAQSKLGVLCPLFLMNLPAQFLKRSTVVEGSVLKKEEIVPVGLKPKRKKKKKNNKNKRNIIKKNLEVNIENNLKALQSKVKQLKKEVSKKKESVKSARNCPSRQRRREKRAAMHGSSVIDLVLDNYVDFKFGLDCFTFYCKPNSPKKKYVIGRNDFPFLFALTKESSVQKFCDLFGLNRSNFLKYDIAWCLENLSSFSWYSEFKLFVLYGLMKHGLSKEVKNNFLQRKPLK